MIHTHSDLPPSRGLASTDALFVTDWGWNHQICTKYASWDTLRWYRKLIYFVRAITCDGFELKSPNLQQICILGFSQLVLKMRVIDLDLQGHLPISTQNSKKQHSTSLLYTNLGQSRGVTCPKTWVGFQWGCWCVLITCKMWHSRQF